MKVYTFLNRHHFIIACAIGSLPIHLFEVVSQCLDLTLGVNKQLEILVTLVETYEIKHYPMELPN